MIFLPTPTRIQTGKKKKISKSGRRNSFRLWKQSDLAIENQAKPFGILHWGAGRNPRWTHTHSAECTSLLLLLIAILTDDGDDFMLLFFQSPAL